MFILTNRPRKTYDGISLSQDLEKIDFRNYNGYYFDNTLYLVGAGFETVHLKNLLEKIDQDKNFNSTSIIVFEYNFESKMLREITDNVKLYANKKGVDIDFLMRY